MGGSRSEFGAGSGSSDSDLERFRENVLDHPGDEVAGNDNSSRAETGPVKVIVKQDGIGRTGGIVLGVFAGVAFGMSVMTIYLFGTSYRELERESRLQQLKMDEFRMALMKADIDPNPHVDGESK